MRLHRLVAIALLAACGWPLTARSEPVTIKGKTYASWTDYFRSAEFIQNGLRCGTPEPVWSSTPGSKPEGVAASPGDCSLGLTNPSGEYQPGSVVVIPVVFHRLESATGQGVFPDSLVRTQVDVLNEDYRAIAGTPGAPGEDTRIEFRLATTDPGGNPSPGWTRTLNEFWFNDQPDPLNGNYYDELAWDPFHYLNVYTLSPEAPGGVVLGYVPWFPQNGPVGSNEDGVRCLWNAFGRTSANAPYDKGRTVTHEVGHYLGLLHTFQDGCGTATQPGCFSTADLICDTEPDDQFHGGCPVNSSGCGDPDPIRNYMEYTDDLCMNNFTPQQARRIVCTIRHYRPDLYEAGIVAVSGPGPRAATSRLAQNVPNPFGPSTELGFSLPSAGRASVVVLDLGGRAVRTLASALFPAGQHSVRWDGTDDRGQRLAAGVYFYRLVTAEGSENRRMIVLR
jgi:pregnancy-associated plasma protein-A/flagellar hook capping protein FlgD